MENGASRSVTSAGEAIWRDDVRVKMSQRDCSEEKITTVPYRCVATNCRNVVDLSKCIFVHNIPSFAD